MCPCALSFPSSTRSILLLGLCCIGSVPATTFFAPSQKSCFQATGPSSFAPPRLIKAALSSRADNVGIRVLPLEVYTILLYLYLNVNYSVNSFETTSFTSPPSALSPRSFMSAPISIPILLLSVIPSSSFFVSAIFLISS